MMSRMRMKQGLFFLIAVMCIALLSSALVFAAEEKKDTRPERGIAVYPEFSTVAVAKGETVRMELTLENKGRADETIDVKISTVKGMEGDDEGWEFSRSWALCGQW